MKYAFTLLLAGSLWFNSTDLTHATSANAIRAHEATYVMSQVRQHGRQSRDSFTMQADGVLKYRFEKTCDGWLVDHQNVLLLTTQDNNEIQMLSSYTSLESFDGKRLQFRGVSENSTDGHTLEEKNIKGWAERQGNQVKITYQSPKETSINMPADTDFPTAHLIKALNNLSEKPYVFGGAYFDGSDIENQFQADTVVVPFTPMNPMDFKGTTLNASPTWMLNLSFYSHKDPSSVPMMEIAARYRPDGVALQLRQDFGDLVLEGTLEKFSYLPPPDC